MLRRLKIENFKAWQKANLLFAPITVFFGTNSSGKSSLLQFLLMLKQTKNSTDYGLTLDFGGPNKLINLGSFKDVVHNHDEERLISWGLGWSSSEKLKEFVPGRSKEEILYDSNLLNSQCEVGLRNEKLWPYKLVYTVENVNDKSKSFSLIPKKGSRNKFELDTDVSNFNFLKNKGRFWGVPHAVKTHLFPSDARHMYQNAHFLWDFEFAYEDFMDSIYYLGPLRDHPQREYQWAGSSPADVGQRGEYVVDAVLSATRDKKLRSLGPRKWKMPFQRMIAHWLRELGLIHEFRIVEISEGSNLYRALVRMPGSRVEVALTDVGFGVSQVLPVLVLLYYVPMGSTVLMEQPEIHLHPAVQSGLADLMLNVAKARNLQIVVESHSEHFLRRLQRRVAEGIASSDSLRMYFISTSRGVAKANDLNLNQWGEIEYWPENFFGDEMGEIAAIAKEGIRRRMEES